MHHILFQALRLEYFNSYILTIVTASVTKKEQNTYRIKEKNKEKQEEYTNLNFMRNI